MLCDAMPLEITSSFVAEIFGRELVEEFRIPQNNFLYSISGALTDVRVQVPPRLLGFMPRLTSIDVANLPVSAVLFEPMLNF